MQVVDLRLFVVLSFPVPAALVVIAAETVRIVSAIGSNADKNGMIAAFADNEQIQKKNSCHRYKNKSMVQTNGASALRKLQENHLSYRLLVCD